MSFPAFAGERMNHPTFVRFTALVMRGSPPRRVLLADASLDRNVAALRGGILEGVELDSGFEVMDQMIAATRRELAEFAGTPLEYLSESMDKFAAEAKRHRAGAGARHMALAIFLLARQQELIERLTDDLSMRDFALKTIFELDEM